VSDLHCPATLLLAPYDEGVEPSEEGTRRLTRRAAADRVARIYAGTSSKAVQTTRAVAAGVDASGEQRTELDNEDDLEDELHAIADLHRGETVLVMLPVPAVERALDALVGRRARARAGASMQYGAVVEVAGNADGWALRIWDAPTDSVPNPVTDREMRDVQPK
jgi:hypothetical protein